MIEINNSKIKLISNFSSFKKDKVINLIILMKFK